MSHKLFIGAHTSTAGGLHHAIEQGISIGATTIQLFTSNQRQWKGRLIKEEDLKLWNQAKESSNLSYLMSHGSYLINLGSPKEETLQKSRSAFSEEITRCHTLDISYLNFHPGSATGETEERCLDIIVESLFSYESLLSQGNTRLLLETTAGQGTNVGYDFSHLAYIIQRTKNKIPIGVCIDTCHIFAAGYDIRSNAGWEQVLHQFDQTVGLDHLYAFHLNDSLKEFGSKRDRHAHLGEGHIGLESFAFLVRCPQTRHLPMYLETPTPSRWPEEILLLRQLASEKGSHAAH
jgi:deoxyribonuclease IV